jgi:predicted RNA-binding Zn ribbon-like protein
VARVNNRLNVYGGYVSQRTTPPDLGDEDLLIAVANTAHGEQDELADPASVRAWWRGLGQPVGTSQSADPAAVAMLRTLRAVIRARALANNGIDTAVDHAGLDRLALRVDLDGVTGLRAEPTGDLARDIAAATVTALLRAPARPSWPRLKACRGEDCRWVYLDGSRNGSRRWCDMAACGNRAKSATFRVRHRGAAQR